MGFGKRLINIRNVVVHLILLLTLPSFIFYPQAHIPTVVIQAQENIETQPNAMRFDDIINLINTIEDGELEQKYSPAELERINCFLAALAKEGIIPDDKEDEAVLENDIQKLISEGDRPYEYVLDHESRYNIISAAFLKNSPSFRFGLDRSNPAEIVLCKSWASKKWKHTRHFVQKHKKAILIGAAIVVATTVVVCAVAAVSAASAAAAAGAQKNKKDTLKPKAEEQSPPPVDAEVANEETVVKEVIDEKVSSFKELVAEDVVLDSLASSKDPAFVEKTRELGGFLAHQVVDGVAEIVSVVPEALEEIRDIGGKIFPEISFEPNPLLKGSPNENFEHIVSDVHEKIDQAFGTNQAGLYTPEAKTKRGRTTIGMIPLPGTFFKGVNAGKFQGIVSSGQETTVLADELGFSSRDIAQLKQSGTLEKTVGATYEAIVNDPAMLASCNKFKAAKEFLKPYQSHCLSEAQVRGLIQQTGIPTFPRPQGIPENFRVKLSKKPGGMKYVHPDHNNESIRVMPGKPYSPNPCQQKPYVVHMRDGKALDKYGNPLTDVSVPEAHIPLEEFIYRKK